MSFQHPHSTTNTPTPDTTDTIPVIQNTESRPRDPRIHRPSDELQTHNNGSEEERHSSLHDTVSGKLGALKRTAYHMLSKSTHSPHHRDDQTSKIINAPAEERPGEDQTEQHAIDIDPYRHPHLPSNPTGRRRFASMPQPLPSSTDADYEDLATQHIGMSAFSGVSKSPPIIDFTRFEDTYRGPRNGNFEGLLARKTSGWKGQGSGIASKPSKDSGSRMASTASSKNNRRSSRGDSLRHAPSTSMTMRNTPSSLSTGLSKDESYFNVAPQPASSRKPDPRSILVAVKEVEDDISRGLQLPRAREIDSYFRTRELLEMHYLDQVDFEEREMVRQKFAQSGSLEVEGRHGALVVMGEYIRRASIYSSSTMILGGREHELPILVVSCIEELYRTGIYQPNLFRALPNRTRLMELISIFDSETQPPGSIIRDRSRPRTSRHISTSTAGNGTPQSSHDQVSTENSNAVNDVPMNTGFGAATSLHLESMPDICALLSTYISSLPEPVLSPVLFRAIWELCGIEEDEIIKPNAESESATHTRVSSSGVPTSPLQQVPISPMHRTYTSTYTSPLASSRILKAQLLLHLLPSPNFSLLVYFLAFFSQAALVREENGVGIEDLAKMFGGKIFGGGVMSKGANGVASAPAPTSREVDEVQSNTAHNARRPSDASSVSNMSASNIQSRRPSITTGVVPTAETRREGEVMMCWFLRRWGPISDGLFEVLTNLGIDNSDILSQDDREFRKSTSKRKWSRNPSPSTRSTSSSSFYSPTPSSPASPKSTPTLPKFLRRDTFGRIPLPQEWLDRISSAGKPISRSLSLTRSRSRSLSLSRSFSASRSRSRSRSPPPGAPEMQLSETNDLEMLVEGGIVHARPDGKTRFQLAPEDSSSKGRKRASSALPYASYSSKSSPRKSRSSWVRNALEQRAGPRDPSQHVIIPVAVPAEAAVPMSVQALEEMDIVDDYGTAFSFLLHIPKANAQTRSDAFLGVPHIAIQRFPAFVSTVPPPLTSLKAKVDTRLLDSFLRNELDITNDSPLTSPFSDIGSISPHSTSPPPESTNPHKNLPVSPLSIPVPPPPVNSLSTTPYISPPLPMNTNVSVGMKLDADEKPRKSSRLNLPTVQLTPPSPLLTPPQAENGPTTQVNAGMEEAAPSPSTPPTTSQPNRATSSPTSPTPTRLRTTIHLVLLQNQLKRRTEALRRALTSSSKHFLRSSYLEERVKELEAWIEEHSKNCSESQTGVGDGGRDRTGGARETPDILKVDAYGRPRERGGNSTYTRAVRPMDLKAMNHQRSKSAGYDGGAGHGKGKR
ncbi:hypothetical protein CVT24_013345 [Panaeolus cyanescens]|uniref:Rho-GAP domain-containing protein n=1 Tax=Panaeolus cyanescens TaxID=181874 RepID=A0A409YNR4_9AGAR|nr:hypothetical protein CVT24_013345 [Panaeolus cyanescens]